jgi:hypothetical protein
MRGTNKRGTNPRNAQGKFVKSKRIKKLHIGEEGYGEYIDDVKLGNEINEIIDLLNEHEETLGRHEEVTSAFHDWYIETEARLTKLEERLTRTPATAKGQYWDGSYYTITTTAPEPKKEKCEHYWVEFHKQHEGVMYRCKDCQETKFVGY